MYKISSDIVWKMRDWIKAKAVNSTRDVYEFWK